MKPENLKGELFKEALRPGTTYTTTYNLTPRQAEMVIVFLEGEMDQVERGPQTDDYLNLWRKVARLKAQADRVRRANDLQVFALELKLRRIRGNKEAW